MISISGDNLVQRDAAGRNIAGFISVYTSGYANIIDSVTKSKSGHLLKEIDAAEKAEIQRLWQPYFEQLPEYEYLREILTSEWP